VRRADAENTVVETIQTTTPFILVPELDPEEIYVFSVAVTLGMQNDPEIVGRDTILPPTNIFTSEITESSFRVQWTPRADAVVSFATKLNLKFTFSVKNNMRNVVVTVIVTNVKFFSLSNVQHFPNSNFDSVLNKIVRGMLDEISGQTINSLTPLQFIKPRLYKTSLSLFHR